MMFQYTLGPETTTQFGDVTMRLNNDIRKCVAFVGYIKTDEAGEEKFVAGGTCFFLNYHGAAYLVTARHVAKELQPPFALRATKADGESLLLDIVSAGWFYHPDDNVDLAVGLGIPHGVPTLAPRLILTPEIAKERNIGIGDETHIVGLYRLLHGKDRNLPIVHSGTIAMVPEDEKIPQRDRLMGVVRHVEGYLVEAQTLEGLSGSPVFVRHSWDLQVNDRRAVMAGDAYLLGIWSGAWDAPPGEVLSLERPEAKRVPVGMGLVVPMYKLLELLEMPNVVEHRNRRIAEEGAVHEDSALPHPEGQEPPTKGENPQHKEDFNRLLSEAVRGHKSDDQT